MAGITTRQEARDHVLTKVKQLLDQMIPEDSSQPVKDGVFWEWEEMADVFDREATASLMEALAGLSQKAKLEQPCACPACGSAKVRWLDEDKQQERQSKHGVVVVIGDGASWIDTIAGEHFACHTRIIDFYHVDERLREVAKALYPVAERERKRLGDRLENQLYQGQVKAVLRWLEKKAKELGPPRESDPPDHPRRVLWENLRYLERHQGQMDYPAYRAKGWPIGSGVTESGVKLFNKRVKGTEQFWNEAGAEAMLALRALWLSQDDRWHHYWLCGQLPRRAA